MCRKLIILCFSIEIFRVAYNFIKNRGICVLIMIHSVMLWNKKHFFFLLKPWIASELNLRSLAETIILQRFHAWPLEKKPKKQPKEKHLGKIHRFLLQSTVWRNSMSFTACLEGSTRIFLVCRQPLDCDQYQNFWKTRNVLRELEYQASSSSLQILSCHWF